MVQAGSGGGGLGNGTSATANTGSGGGGTGGSTPGNGGSGIVILRFDSSYNISIGSGLTSSSATDGTDTVVTFTAGTDVVKF